jgi:hypothetical protein
MLMMEWVVGAERVRTLAGRADSHQADFVAGWTARIEVIMMVNYCRCTVVVAGPVEFDSQCRKRVAVESWDTWAAGRSIGCRIPGTGYRTTCGMTQALLSYRREV